MCDCFKPAYSEYEFGYALGVLGHEFSPDDSFAYGMFAGIDRFNNEQALRRLGNLIEGLLQEIDRASQGELDEIAEFKIQWHPITDFQTGYLDGLKSMLKALVGLFDKAKSDMRDNARCEVFENHVLPWSEQWQSQNSKSDMLEVQPFASDPDDWQIRILSLTRASLVTDLNPDTLTWLECEMLIVNPVEEIVSELWKVLGTKSDQGISFSSQFGEISPADLERTKWQFEIENICEDHWSTLEKFNKQYLDERGLI